MKTKNNEGKAVLDTVAEVSAMCDDILAEREKEISKIRKVKEDAKKELREIEEANEKDFLESDAPEAYAENAARAAAAKIRLEMAEKKMKELEEKPLMTESEYRRLKGKLLDAAETEKQDFLTMLSMHAAMLANEAERLSEYGKRVNDALHKLQMDVYRDHDRREERNGRSYYHPVQVERVEYSGLYNVARSLMLSPILSGIYEYKNPKEVREFFLEEFREHDVSEYAKEYRGGYDAEENDRTEKEV